MGIGVSAHRKFPLGSVSSDIRRQGLDILYRSIELAADLGVKVIQIMGYDAFYEPSNADTEARFLEGLQTGVGWASAAGITMALENVDSELVDSVEKAMRFVKKLNSPWFQVYPDIGNMTAAGFNPLEQLPLSEGHLVGVHVKDIRIGESARSTVRTGNCPVSRDFQFVSKNGFYWPAGYGDVGASRSYWRFDWIDHRSSLHNFPMACRNLGS